MIALLFIFCLCPLSYADVFDKPSTDEQRQLDTVIGEEGRGFYLRNGIDLNLYQPHIGSDAFNKDNVPLGPRQFNFKNSLKNLIITHHFNGIETKGIIDSLSVHPLMIYQYASPAQADLYKHLDTIAHLRLSLRYRQYEDLERFVDDPLTRLRKQAEVDCLRRRAGNGNQMDRTFESCLSQQTLTSIDNSGAQGRRLSPFGTLDDPVNGQYITGNVNIIEESLKRAKNQGDHWQDIRQIIPEAVVSQNNFEIRPAQKTITEVLFDYRKYFIQQLENLIRAFKQEKTVSESDLKDFYVAGVPLTEAQVRNIAMLGEPQRYLAVDKLGSRLAYLKTMDQYAKALGWLGRAMDHPAIEPGYKVFIQSRADYLRGQMEELKFQKAQVQEYAGFMGTLLDLADQERLKTIAQLSR